MNDYYVEFLAERERSRDLEQARDQARAEVERLRSDVERLRVGRDAVRAELSELRQALQRGIEEMLAEAEARNLGGER